jgi:hypothetical protein
MEKFIEYCKDYIIDNIEAYEDEKVHACDLADTLMSGPYYDGTLTYSRSQAKDYLIEWWDDCADFLEYSLQHFCEFRVNPFENPESFIVGMVSEGIAGILCKVPFVDEHWDGEEITLTPEIIQAIKDGVEEFDDDGEVF